MFEWFDRHPAFAFFVVWPVISAIISIALKPRTPEEYAALPPRIAAVLKMIAALGIDAPKAQEAARQIFFGRARPVEMERIIKGDFYEKDRK